MQANLLVNFRSFTYHHALATTHKRSTTHMIASAAQTAIVYKLLRYTHALITVLTDLLTLHVGQHYSHYSSTEHTCVTRLHARRHTLRGSTQYRTDSHAAQPAHSNINAAVWEHRHLHMRHGTLWVAVAGGTNQRGHTTKK